MNVLLVDDEADFLDTLLKRIRKRGVSAVGVNSGAEALVYLSRNPVDVVVLDVKMPEMDGLEVLKAVKGAYPLIEVIMLTGHANVEVAIEGMELGAFDYLMKPMDIDELIYKIQDAWKRKSLQQAKIRRVSDEFKRGKG